MRDLHAELRRAQALGGAPLVALRALEGVPGPDVLVVQLALPSQLGLGEPELGGHLLAARLGLREGRLGAREPGHGFGARARIEERRRRRDELGDDGLVREDRVAGAQRRAQEAPGDRGADRVALAHARAPVVVHRDAQPPALHAAGVHEDGRRLERAHEDHDQRQAESRSRSFA